MKLSTKLIRIVLTVTLLFLLTIATAKDTKAQALSYQTCIQVQNLEGSLATISITFYEQSSSSVYVVDSTVAANGSTTFCPLSAIPVGFNGSGVISSDKNIAAIVNVTGGSPAWSSFDASYGGFPSGAAATSVNIPLLMKGNYGFNTWFNVQNAGGTGTANVTVNYSDGSSASHAIGVNQSWTFDQSAETHSATVFAASVTSDQPVVVTVLEVGPTMLFGYNGFTSSVTSPVFPLVQANNYGYTSGVQIQNTGGSSTDVTVTYTPSAAGTACTETHTIGAGASATFALRAWDAADPDPSHNTCVNSQTFVGGAQVTANSASMGLVGIVNQHNFSTNKGAAYGSFDPSTATATVVIPLVMDRNYGYFTGFNIMNVGTNQATVSCTFSGTSVTVPATVLNPGAALTHVQLNQIASGYVGAATCTATGTSPKIIGVVNELLNVGTTDTFLVYEAFSN